MTIGVTHATTKVAHSVMTRILHFFSEKYVDETLKTLQFQIDTINRLRLLKGLIISLMMNLY